MVEARVQGFSRFRIMKGAATVAEAKRAAWVADIHATEE